jgi:ProP effector
MLVQQRPAKSEQNMTKAARRARIDAVIRLLCDSFPQTFSRRGQYPRPLKVGVYADALAALGCAIQPRDLRSALRAYTSRGGYLRALTAGAPRIGIEGEPAGAVTPDEELVAKARLAELAKRAAPTPVPGKTTLAAQNELETPAQTSAAEVANALAPADPKRLSLADLREAGRRRREAAIQVTDELRSAPA